MYRLTILGLRSGILLGTALAILLAAPTAFAQTTFTVTVGPKTQAHPQFGQGWDESYRIDGVDGAVVTLERGETYNFQMSNVPVKHPFYISTSDAGGSQGIWNDGVTGNFATGNATLTFTVPDHAPDELWYQCASHVFMGWRIDVTGKGVGTEGGSVPASFEVAGPFPNPTTGSISLLVDLPEVAEVRVIITDLLGRVVAEKSFGSLSPGSALALEVGTDRLAAGSYVYRVEAATATETLSASGQLVRAP